MRVTKLTRLFAINAGVLILLSVPSWAATFTASAFAGGAAVSAVSPDSIFYSGGSVWVSYQNGADSAGASGSSLVVQYSPAGAVLNTYTIPGNVDGLRMAPNGQVWALQNNDGNSALTLINPATNTTTSYSYGSSYTNGANRGFDDVAFLNGATYLSETNPVSGTDSVIVKLTSALASPLQLSGILSSTFLGTNLATGQPGSTSISDSDSLVLDPAGDLVLTGEADQEIVFVHNPGAANQSESFVNLLNPGGQSVTGFPDDTVFNTAASGTFYIADTGANTVYALKAAGLTAGSVYVDVGNEFGSLDTTTGIVTPLFTGVSPHGVVFVATPEPASFLLAGLALLVGVGVVGKFRARTGW